MATRQKPAATDWHAKFDEVVERADAIDRRRRLQVDTQKQVINRLLVNRGWSWREEQEELVKQLVAANAKLEQVEDLVAGMRYSKVARDVAKILEYDVTLPEDEA